MLIGLIAVHGLAHNNNIVYNIYKQLTAIRAAVVSRRTKLFTVTVLVAEKCKDVALEEVCSLPGRGGGARFTQSPAEVLARL